MNAIAPLPPDWPAAGAGVLAERFQAKYADRITGALTIPESAGDYVSFPDDLPESLAQALRSKGIHRLYSHQAHAWNAAARSDNIVVVTPTASGKSLCYTLPV